MDVQQPAPSLKRRHSMNESHVPEKVRRIGNIDEIKQSAIEGGKQCSYKYPSCGLVLSYTNHANTYNSKRKRLPNNTNIINNYKCMCSSPKRVKIDTTIQKFSFIAQKMEFKNEFSQQICNRQSQVDEIKTDYNCYNFWKSPVEDIDLFAIIKSFETATHKLENCQNRNYQEEEMDREEIPTQEDPGYNNFNYWKTPIPSLEKFDSNPK